LRVTVLDISRARAVPRSILIAMQTSEDHNSRLAA
jgi:hypothetical protein